MTTNTDAAVDAIRRAWGIGISEAEADSAACAIEDRKLLRPDKPESYWSRALRNLMMDYARHSKARKHTVLEILYPRRTGRRNYVEDALIEAIDASRQNRRQQETQINNILNTIVKVGGRIEYVNSTGTPHDMFVRRLEEQKKIPSLRLRSSVRFVNPVNTRGLLTVQLSSYFSWPSEHHEWPIKRSAVSLHASDEVSRLPRNIECYFDSPIPENAVLLDL